MTGFVQAARSASESVRCSPLVSIPGLLSRSLLSSSPGQAGRSVRLCPCGHGTLNARHRAAVRHPGSLVGCEAAGLRCLHGHSRSAGLSHLADKALRLALRGTPVVTALAVIVVDPDHAWEHVYTRFPDGAQH